MTVVGLKNATHCCYIFTAKNAEYVTSNELKLY